MSQYSLQILSASKYREEFEDVLIYNFENYLMQKRFKVGSGIENEDELEHTLQLYDLMCTTNCSLQKLIQDKIEGKLENPPKKKKTINHLIQQFSKENNCSEEESCNTLMTWENVMW